MKISGFTIIRNAVKLNYPVLESIISILPICDEFIVNVGQSNDGTLEMIRSLDDPKIKIIESKWDDSQGLEVLSTQTNLALKYCKGDWAFYLQSDEFIHEKDLGRLKGLMYRYLKTDVEAFRFEWLHFYGSFLRYRDDNGWYQKSDRIIRNNGEVESFADAYSFRRKDGRPLKRKNTGCLLYHYGWVDHNEFINKKIDNHKQIGFELSRLGKENQSEIDHQGLRKHPIYFGTHPLTMNHRMEIHNLTQEDQKYINRIHCCNPFKIFKFRYKRHRGLIRKTLNYKVYE